MRHRPDCVAVEDIFHARNVRSALKLGEARGVALLAASEAGVPVVSYAPAAIKRAVVGYGRAEKHQVQQMVKLLLNLEQPPTPHDVADALAVALATCSRRRVPFPSGCAPTTSNRNPRSGPGATIGRDCSYCAGCVN